MAFPSVDNALKRNVTDESIAYGYTLTIWGSGAFLIQFLNLTPSHILAYVGGGVAGFGFLSSVVFSDLFGDVYSETERERLIVASMIHIFASFGNVILSYLLVQFLAGKMNPMYIFFVVGFHATVTYNIMLVVEELISVKLYQIEHQLSES